MRSYVLNFPEIDKTMQADVGGKGANLGELTRIPRNPGSRRFLHHYHGL